MGWNSGWVIYCVDTFPHDAKLHRFTSPFAPCVQQTPPLINNSVGAPLEAASFPLCAMCDANSSPSGLDWYILQSCIVFPPSYLRRASNRPLPFGQSWYIPLEAATLSNHDCSMCNANSSPHYLVGTPLKATSLLLSASDTNASHNDLIGTSLVTTWFPRCAMRPTHSSLHGSLIHPFWLHFFLPVLMLALTSG